MGVGQALALQPGVSRSGVTISVARRLGMARDAAARLSFLMSLPIIAGAGFYKLASVMSEGGIPAEMRSAFFWGVCSSAVTGWFAVWGTLRLVRTRTFTPFVLYRFAAAIGVLGILASGAR
jgi:undecaprenyl-diphosphatase